MKNLKQWVFCMLQPDEKETKAEKIFDVFIISLIIINVVMVIADKFSLPAAVKTAFEYLEFVSVIVFTIEYLLRLWTARLLYPGLSAPRAYIKYIFSFMAIIDLLAILPFYLPYIFPIDLRVLRTLRIVRLFRLFKVNRYTNSLSLIAKVFKSKASQLVSSVFVVGLLMVISSVLMYSIENPVQPDVFKNAFSGLWWAVATFTTVGYGDIYPITGAGKILSAIIAMLGIGLVAVPTGIISAGFIENISEEEAAEEEKKHYCPYCGKKID